MIILASASPQRKELLAMAGFTFKVMPANVDETADPSLSPEQLVEFLSKKKAQHIYDQNIWEAPAIIVGADTVVSIDNQILGKPSSPEEAFEMLTQLQGRAHVVYTGVTLIPTGGQAAKSFVESAQVFMRRLSPQEIHEYIATGEPSDKAGSYGIQKKGALLIEKVNGDYFTVVGFPLCRFNLALRGL